MAVTIDGGNVTGKTTKSFSAKKSYKPAAPAPAAPPTAPSPTANSAVAVKKAAFTQQAGMTKLYLANSYQPPVQTPQQQADAIIEVNGGRSDLDTDAAGADLAQIALNNPETANQITTLILDDIKGNDKDEIAQAFAESLTDEQLTTVAENKFGKEMIETLQDELLSGKVHGDERATSNRMTNALQGFPTPDLQGNTEADIETVANDLAGLTPKKQAQYLAAVLDHPYGAQTLERVGSLSVENQEIIVEGLNNAYNDDPAAVNALFDEIVSSDRLFPVYEWSGFANVVSQTGNDRLIASFADKAIDYAAANPEHYGVSVDAMQALSGMSPDALATFISFRSATPPQSGSPTALGQAASTNQAQFEAVLADAVNWLDADANSAGFPNPWAFNPALGNLLDTASQMTTANGKPTEAALKIFEIVAPSTGDNFFTKQAAGAFFIEHSQVIVDRYAALRTESGATNRHFDPEILKDFFVGVVYSPISHILEYKGQPMVDIIMGDGENNLGLVGDITDTLLQRAVNGGDPEAIGREIGYLFGAISGGFLDSVEAYKDQFNEDKEFREFLYGYANKGLAALGKKAGIPLDKIAAFGQKLYEAGLARERSAKLTGFQEALLDYKDQIRFELLDFENGNPDSLGIEESFTIGWTDFITSYLASDWIVS